MRTVMKAVIVVLALLVLAGGGLLAWYRLSPWPAVLIVRNSFDAGAQEAKASVAPFVPDDVVARHGLSYLAGEPDALLDLFVPEGATAPLPLVVWVHGGGFIAGTRDDLTGYLKVLADRGYAVAAIDYTLAPEARFPTPVRQTNAALAWLVQNATAFGLDPQRIFLAGDSAGAQIAAQAALGVAEPS